MQLTAADVQIEAGETIARLVPSRLPASLLTSAALHALGLVLAIRYLGPMAVPSELPRPEIIPVSLVSLPGGGGGAKGKDTPAPPPAASVIPPRPASAPTAVTRKPPTTPRPVATPRARPAPRAAAPAAAASADTAAPASGESGAGAGARHGGGDGSGGDGSGGAAPAYGSTPDPPYPRAARRLGIEGRVLLEVLVSADGRAAAVSVRASSGHRMLDDAARDTVRTRWRFVPARHNGIPVQSTVTVPIRFRIDQG